MTLPIEYNAAATEAEINRVSQAVTNLYSVIPLIPLSVAPSDPKVGWVSYSDGTGSGFDGASGAGLYVYKTGGWTFVV